MPTIRVTFRKDAAARFLSHLDLMATLEYAMRRARLPLELSEGFNPRPRMALAAPLALGYVGAREILEITLRHSVPPHDIQRALQTALPAGITLISVDEFADGQKSAASRMRGSVYRIRLVQPIVDLSDRVEALLCQEEAWIEEKREKGARRRNVRPLIESIRLEDQSTLCIDVVQNSSGTLRPEQVLDLLGVPTEGAVFTRERIVQGD